MRTHVVLAMHGSPPNDFPRRELGEFFALHSKVESGTPLENEVRARYQDLEGRIRNWPRDGGNDPFHSGSMRLASEIGRELEMPVIVGFNEFCAPDLATAFEQAVGQRAERVIVVTPMLTRGGGHSEDEIPQAIEAARRKHPEVAFHYAWPIGEPEVARFLADQVRATLAAG
ncbi:MAG TPA: CbiX/SirB N-terminal domain-containing protein [Candidatus Methylomirabilis sp.]